MWLIGRLKDAAQIPGPGKKHLLPPLQKGAMCPTQPASPPGFLGSGVWAENWATGSPLGPSVPKEAGLELAQLSMPVGFSRLQTHFKSGFFNIKITVLSLWLPTIHFLPVWRSFPDRDHSLTGALSRAERLHGSSGPGHPSVSSHFLSLLSLRATCCRSVTTGRCSGSLAKANN